MSAVNKQKIYSEYLGIVGTIKFTSREIDIIASILHNRGEKKIANLLSISSRTVSSHVHNIMLKCKSHSKDGIIDFIEQSGKLPYLKEYYIELLINEKLQQKLKKITDQKEIDSITQEFEKNYEKIKASLSGDIYPSEKSFKTDNKKGKSLYSLKLIIIPIIIAISIIIFFQAQYNSKHVLEHIVARSDLILPHDNILLKRTQLQQEIERKISGPESIKTVVLVGIGGAGKTTLAREYARKQNNPIVWEINAENGCLLYSFENLAYSLTTSEEERVEINNIQKMNNVDEKIKKLESFLAKKARKNPGWLLIYNNIESFENIRKYFPYNAKVWGTGRVIITTRDANISNNSYISNNNIITVGELTYDEKLELFNKIIDQNIDKVSDLEKRQLENLIQTLPSFPLDVSTAAHYIKREKISYEKYLKYISKPDQDLSDLQEESLKDIDEYNKTRYQIITTSIKHIISTNPEFKELLFLITMLDPESIPKDLLTSYKDEIIINKLMYELRKFSLITENIETASNNISSFSIHRSTQAIAFSYLMHSIEKSEFYNILRNITIALDNYMTSELNKSDIVKLKLLTTHLEIFLTHTNIFDGPYYADLYYKLGHAYFDIATYQKAKQFFELAYNLYRERYGENDIKTALASARLGVVYRNIGDYKEARDLLEKSWIVYNRHYGKNNLEAAKIAIYLASVYRNTGDDEKAKILAEKAYWVYKSNYQKDDINLSLAKAYLGTIYNDIGEYKEAKDLLEDAFINYQKYYGTDHTKTAWVSVRLASVYKNLNDSAKAEILLKKAIEIYKLHNGTDSIEVAWVLTHEAIIYSKLGNNKKALGLILEGLAIYNKHLKPDHIVIGWVKLHLSDIYIHLKKEQLATEALKASQQIYEKYHGKDHIKTIETFSELEK
jgi:DNA-binding CsgD family transcriptional regulator